MRFQCPNCKGIVSVDNGNAGKEIECGHCHIRVPAPASRISPGSVFSDFVIQKEIGRGGMGIVYLSHQISLDRPAALKVLSDVYAKNSEFVIGFIKEARSAAKLNHPNIVQAYAVGEDDGMYYFAMEYVEGRTMKQILDEEKVIPCDKASLIIEQIADALDYAWKEAHLIHRDIKPDNIMLTDSGRAKLADLGLAKRAEDKDELGSDDEVMGTPQYISPEHLTGAPMDVRSDLYSLGATFYHFVTGRFPFTGESAVDIAKKHLEEELEPPVKVNPKIPVELSNVIVKMMAKNPDDRYQDAEKLVDELRSLRKKKPKLQLNLPGLGGTQTGPIIFSSMQKPGASASAGSAPKLSLKIPAGTASGQSVSPAPQGSSVPVLKPGKTAASQTQNESVGQKTSASETDQNVTQTGLEEVIEKKESSSRKKFILLIASSVLALLLIAGGVSAAFFSPQLKEKFTGLFAKKTSPAAVLPAQTKAVAPVKAAAPKPVPEPESTPYTVKAKEIVRYAEGHIFDSKVIADSCEDFILKNPNPKYRVELAAREQILKTYAQAEEALIGTKRTNMNDARRRAEVEANLLAEKRRREELEQREKQRFAEAERKRIEEENRRRQAEQKRIADEKRREQNRIINENKQLLMRDFTGIRLKIYFDCSGDRYDEALSKLDKIIQAAENMQGMPGEVVALARNNASAAKQIRKFVLSARKFRDVLESPETVEKIRGISFVHKHSLAVVQSLKDGVLTLKTGGKEITVKAGELSSREKRDFLKRAAKNTGMENADMVSYFLLQGQIADAVMFLYLLPKNDRNEFNLIAQEILLDQYRKANPNQKRTIEKTFGKPPFHALKKMQ